MTRALPGGVLHLKGLGSVVAQEMRKIESYCQASHMLIRHRTLDDPIRVAPIESHIPERSKEEKRTVVH